MLIAIIRTLIALWPFIRENVLGNKEIDYLNARNRPMTLMLLSVLIMFALFVYVTDHAFVNSNDLQKAKHKEEILTIRLEELSVREKAYLKEKERLLVRISELERFNDSYSQQLSELSSQNTILLSLTPGQGDHTANVERPLPGFTKRPDVSPQGTSAAVERYKQLR